mgnify:CR=1 FL=1
MLINLLMLFTGGFCGVMCMSCIYVNSINEERERAFRRGYLKAKRDMRGTRNE